MKKNIAGRKAATSSKRAREIMGKNFFGVYEAVKYFGLNPTHKQSAILWKVPFSESVLKKLKDTHVLVAVFPFSILDIRDKVDDALFWKHKDGIWYDKESFAKRRGETSWQLVRKIPIPNSMFKTWNEQHILFFLEETTLNARVVVYTTIGHYMATGERLFKFPQARTSTVDSRGQRVNIVFSTEGLILSCNRNDSICGYMGTASARRGRVRNSKRVRK